MKYLVFAFILLILFAGAQTNPHINYNLSTYGDFDSIPSFQRVFPPRIIQAIEHHKATGSHNTIIGQLAPSEGVNNTMIGLGAGRFLTTQHDVFIMGENIPAKGFANDSTIYLGNESTTITIRAEGSLSVGDIFIKKDPSLYETMRRCEQSIRKLTLINNH